MLIVFLLFFFLLLLCVQYKPKTLNPKWLEQFDFYMFDEQTSYLELSVWDHDVGGRDDLMGRSSVAFFYTWRRHSLMSYCFN